MVASRTLPDGLLGADLMVSATDRPSTSIFSAMASRRCPSSVSTKPSGLRSNSLMARSFSSSEMRRLTVV